MNATARVYIGPLIWVESLNEAQQERDTLTAERIRVGKLKPTPPARPPVERAVVRR